jgi:hypothetical protein
MAKSHFPTIGELPILGIMRISNRILTNFRERDKPIAPFDSNFEDLDFSKTG